ncbi:MAG: hypothetical protein DHS80DRAFT_13256 [Piptocephalis tieghemiana]|nr:MAG: hypothetical protein DHS80DRAFT_13256 [Piptocephalis tieghemiana]
MVSHLLYETASGYALFECTSSDEIGLTLDSVQSAVQDSGKATQLLKVRSFLPFKSAADALENQNEVSEGVCSSALSAFLDLNLAKASKKKSKVVLGVTERNLAGSIKAATGLSCTSEELVWELGRIVRLHADHLLSQLKSGDLEKAQLGLGHAYSRAKVKFNVNRSDNMIIQAIALLDQLDKDVNTFSMRIREWYSWHFPELSKIIQDHAQFAKLARFIRNKSELTEAALPGLEEITEDAGKAQQILDASRTSMGTDISPIDLINIEHFATRVISLAQYRTELSAYLSSKMSHVAPNLAALIGDSVGARLISHAGSLTNLSKYPASTVQILGAEKALFRALKTKGKTPKYGLIYHSSFIGRAGQKNKGRISRFLANKCTIASRIDCFSDEPSTTFGEALHQQVEDRLAFYESGGKPTKNAEVMRQAMKKTDGGASSKSTDASDSSSSKKAKKAKKGTKRPADGEEPAKKKKKKSKA